MKWKKKIENATRELGTYKPEFDVSIQILGDILEKRDLAEKAFKKDGSEPLIWHSNKSLVTHPALKLAIELETAALPYIRELGLTSASLLKMKSEKKEAPAECKLESLRSRFKVG